MPSIPYSRLDKICKSTTNCCRSACVLKSECLGRLIELATKSRYDLPQAAKRGLLRAVVQVGAAFRDQTYEDQYWSQTLQPLLSRFKEIISNENLPRTFHQEEVRVQLIDVLESFIGKHFVHGFQLIRTFLVS